MTDLRVICTIKKSGGGESDLSATRPHYNFSEPVTKDLNSDTEMANHRGKNPKRLLHSLTLGLY